MCLWNATSENNSLVIDPAMSRHIKFTTLKLTGLELSSELNSYLQIKLRQKVHLSLSYQPHHISIYTFDCIK